MSGRGVTSEEQLRRQLGWLSDSWLWLIRSKVLPESDPAGIRPTALDVGCGPGLVMELFSPLFDVKGLDQDSQMVRTARENGFEALQASAMSLPFDDGSFDVVYCSFTLLWVDDPQRAVQEMARVARRHVVCLAEPDYGGRIVVPKEVADLDQYLVRSMMDEGADPYIGRRLGALMENAGLRADVGVHSGTWTVGRLRNEAASEWDSIEDAARPMIGRKALDRARKAWNDATSDGSLLFYNPVFYAIGNK